MDASGLGSRAVLRGAPQLAPLTPAEKTKLKQVAVARQLEERRVRAVLTPYAIEGVPIDVYGRVLLLEREGGKQKLTKRKQNA